MTVCIIPARKNSKRIKNKNLINFFEKPIISYAINLAKKSKLFSKIIVSTDSLTIAEVAKKYGAEVPFIRSKKLSDDYTNTIDVIKDAVKKISSEKEKFHCCIYPTAVIARTSDLINAYKKIKKTKADYLIAITDFEYSPYRALKKTTKHNLKFHYEKYVNKRSQDLPELFHDTGSFYFYKTKALLNKKKGLPKMTTFFKIDRIRSIDINNYEDLELAKIHYLYLKKNDRQT